jgi:hypothetical protein
MEQRILLDQGQWEPLEGVLPVVFSRHEWVFPVSPRNNYLELFLYPRVHGEHDGPNSALGWVTVLGKLVQQLIRFWEVGGLPLF